MLKGFLGSIRNKAKAVIASVAVVATAASAQAVGVVGAVSTAAASGQADFEGIIAAVTPVVFIIVVASVAIGLGIRLFKKG